MKLQLELADLTRQRAIVCNGTHEIYIPSAPAAR
jgi:hypothetical protein